MMDSEEGAEGGTWRRRLAEISLPHIEADRPDAHKAASLAEWAYQEISRGFPLLRSKSAGVYVHPNKLILHTIYDCGGIRERDDRGEPWRKRSTYEGAARALVDAVVVPIKDGHIKPETHTLVWRDLPDFIQEETYEGLIVGYCRLSFVQTEDIMNHDLIG